jgi:cytochrome c oxidase cbb3-type subunit 1
MSRITVWFIKCAMIYFLLAVLLGILLSVMGPVYPYMPIHVHFNLLGWMSMMVFGVGYHILPRFSGKPLWSERLSLWHLWLANIGLIGMAAGWLVRGYGGGAQVLLVFALVESVSIVFFALNMFKTIKAIPPPPKPAKA